MRELCLAFVLMVACREPGQPPQIGSAADTLGAHREPEPPAPTSTPPEPTTTPLEDVAPIEEDVPKAEIMGWVVLAPEERGFYVELPSEPSFELKPVTGPTGINGTLWQWNASDTVAGTTFVIAVAPLVQQLVDHGDLDLALDRTMATIGRQPAMTMTETRKITKDDIAGREADVVVSAQGDERHAKVQLFLAHYRMYNIIGMWADDAGKTQVEKFFGSFRFVAAAPEVPLDLWRTSTAPYDQVDVALPGRPDRSSWQRQTSDGPVDVESLTLLSSFPPALYTLNVSPLPEAVRADQSKAAHAKLLDRWAAGLAPKPKKIKEYKTFAATARMALGEKHGWLGFVHGEHFYEMVWQTLTSGKPVSLEPPPELTRWFDSPRVHPATAPSKGAP